MFVAVLSQMIWTRLTWGMYNLVHKISNLQTTSYFKAFFLDEWEVHVSLSLLPSSM